MSPVELALRAGAIAQLTVLILVLLRQRQDNALYIPLAMLLIGILGYTIAPITVDHGLRSMWSYPWVTLASAIPLLFWHFSCRVFLDGFVLRPWMLVLGCLSLMLSLMAFCDYADASRCSGEQERMTYLIATAGKFLWTLAAFFVIAKDWRADLVEPRRNLRRMLTLSIGCYIFIVLVVEVFVPDEAPLALEVLNMSLVAAALTSFSVLLLRPQAGNLFTQLLQHHPPATQETSPLATQLVHQMTQQRAYARDGLTIDSLAGSLATTPHQLRKVINGELGFRNFNAFINDYRVREVAQRMQTQEYAQTPVLTLALDAGFRSMAPFNRAFKGTFGRTPSEYRSGQ